MKSGDTAAFERVFQYYSRSMFYVAMGLVEDRQIAEDAVQESFMVYGLIGNRLIRIMTFNIT
ncbi:MAG: RNA polymerase sigma factor [Odoribacter splanchnicus]